MTRTDYIVVILALCALPWLYIKYWSANDTATNVIISTYDNKKIILPLSENKTINVKGPLGENIIEINNNKARFINSPCPNKICIHSGWLEDTNDVAACLPNGVSISIGNRHQEFDAINF